MSDTRPDKFVSAMARLGAVIGALVVAYFIEEQDPLMIGAWALAGVIPGYLVGMVFGFAFSFVPGVVSRVFHTLFIAIPTVIGRFLGRNWWVIAAIVIGTGYIIMLRNGW